MYERILLPVSNPQNAEYTLKAALQLLDHDGIIILLSVVGTREDYPDRAESYRKKTNLLTRLMTSVQPEQAEIVPEIIRSSSVRDTIFSQIATHNIDLTILGYSLQSTLYKIRYGDVIYPIMKDASCDIILANLKREPTFTRILIPSAGYKHSLRAVDIARALAEKAHGHITILHVSESGESDVQAELQLLALKLENVDVSIQSGSVSDRILQTAKNYDIVIMGASERSRGASAIFGTVVDRVIEQASANILVVRA
ncbi:MAG: universal stress protein [Halobacteriota archaeon]